MHPGVVRKRDTTRHASTQQRAYLSKTDGVSARHRLGHETPMQSGAPQTGETSAQNAEAEGATLLRGFIFRVPPGRGSGKKRGNLEAKDRRGGSGKTGAGTKKPARIKKWKDGIRRHVRKLCWAGRRRQLMRQEETAKEKIKKRNLPRKRKNHIRGQEKVEGQGSN